MFSKELPVWEALIDGELTYKNENIISIAMNSSINTGTAKGNLKITFYNFDPISGDQLTIKTLVNNEQEFNQLVKKYYDKEVLTSYNNEQQLINNKDFKRPETIGFSDDGVIIFYNSYELLFPASEVLEFTIPYSVANPYLTF